MARAKGHNTPSAPTIPEIRGAAKNDAKLGRSPSSDKKASNTANKGFPKETFAHAEVGAVRAPIVRVVANGLP